MDKEREARGYVEWQEKLVIYHHQAKEEESEICRTLVNLWKNEFPKVLEAGPDLTIYTHHMHIWDDDNRLLLVFGFREDGWFWKEVRDKDFELMVAKAAIQLNKQNLAPVMLLANNWNELETVMEQSKNVIVGFGYPQDTKLYDLLDWQYHYNGTHTYTVPNNPIVRVDLGALMYDDKGYRRNDELEIVHEPGADLWASADMAMVELKGLSLYVSPEPDVLPIFHTDYDATLKRLDEKHKAAGDYDFMKRVRRMGKRGMTEEDLIEAGAYDGDYENIEDEPDGGYIIND